MKFYYALTDNYMQGTSKKLNLTGRGNDIESRFPRLRTWAEEIEKKIMVASSE